MRLTNEGVESIVKQATFKNIKEDPGPKYDMVTYTLGRSESQKFSHQGITMVFEIVFSL